MYIINILYFISGLIIGSFINVIIYRIPKSLSIIKPRSFCPLCKNKIPLYRNIPIISFCLQRGKCANCKNKISLLYPTIELTIGILWLIASMYFNTLNEILYFSIIATILIAISIIDYKYFIIPIELSITALTFITISLCLTQNFLNHIDGLIIGTGYLSAIFLLTWALTKRQGLGLGDIQLVLILGYWLGDLRIFLVIFLSALLALIFWCILSLIKGYDNKRALPFGTFLSITAILVYPIKINIFI
jgi:leader peptidase (prepilin peptidase)/N-methyltransferase